MAILHFPQAGGEVGQAAEAEADIKYVDFGGERPLLGPINEKRLDPAEISRHSGTVEFLGEVAIVESRETQHGDEEPRAHHLLHVNVGGFRQTVWYTEPAADHPLQLTIANKPGMGEIIENGVGWEYHRQLAHELPGARVLSHATYGFGPTAEQVPLRDLADYGLDQLALLGVDLLRMIPKDSPLVVAGSSLGTIINNRVLNANLEADEPVEVKHVVHHAPALVEPPRVTPTMRVHFLPELGLDLGLELFRPSPIRIVENIRTLVASRPRLRDVVPTARLAFDVMEGTPIEQIEKVLEHYPTTVIAGKKDAVAEIGMWQKLEAKYGNLDLKPLPRRRHGITLKPKEKARKIAKTVAQTGLYNFVA